MTNSLGAPSPAIVVDQVSVRFQTKSGSVDALAETSLSVGESQFVSLVGPSGCGKSTLLNVVAGLLPGRDQRNRVQGNVMVLGRPVQRKPDPAVGYLFQSDTLLPWLSLARNVGLPLMFNRTSGSSDRISGLLDSVGLSGFEKRFPRELSGGMRKRAQIAQVLAQDPAVILMDEPFGALDAQTRVLLQGQLLEIWERSAKTVLFVTHDLNEAILLSDRIVCMSARPGHILLDIEVPIPRPRVLEDVIRGAEYAKIYKMLWSTLESEANAAMAGVQS